MSKRGHGEGGSGGMEPPSKRSSVIQFEPIRIQSATVDEMDLKTLQFQNKRLSERIADRRKAETELKNKIEQLEQRLTADDSVLLVVNRYWNQLDENVRAMLERFDVESNDTDAVYNESEELKSFLNQLSSVDSDELTDKLKQRVEFSKWAVGKLMGAYDRHLWRYARLVKSFKKKQTENETSAKEPSEEDKEKDDKARLETEVDLLKTELIAIQKQNVKLQNEATKLHERHHKVTLEQSQLQDKLSAEETRTAELRNSLADLHWQLEQTQHRSRKLEHALADAAQQKKSAAEVAARLDVSGSARREGDDKELDEMRDLAENRLSELEKLQTDHQDKIRDVERLKQDLKTLPAAIITESPEYKCLQSQFSVLYNEATVIRSQLEEMRTDLANARNEHLHQIHTMEISELEAQRKLKTELMRSEQTIGDLRREYESLRVEFEQLLAANEQTGPINREMRQLITNLQTTNKQLKLEIQRYRRKAKEANAEVLKLKSELDREALQSIKKEPSSDTAGPSTVDAEEGEIKEEVKVKLEPDVKRERRDSKEIKEEVKGDTETERRLRLELKKAQDSHKEVKLLLDMYKSAPKDQRDRAEGMANERKLKQEIDDLKKILRRLEAEKNELERRERKQIAESEAQAKVKKMEEINSDLHKRLGSQKQEEAAIMKELEVTGQAYEELEEQNARLLQQLREKDDANFKLLSDRVKSSQVVKMLKDEKEVLSEQLTRHLQQRAAQQQVIADLEETDRTLRTALATLEAEVRLRQQALDQHKRKAVESAQAAADLKLHADKYHSQLREAQTALQDKTAAVQQESYKHKRLQEEITGMTRRLERAQKIQAAQSADEVLLEEIREYKEQLTCPSCKVKRKDAVLTKCFHVFCLECLKTRYETRQRKCPKCNAGFGANDYRRLYLD